MPGYPRCIDAPLNSKDKVSLEELVNAADGKEKFILITGPHLTKRLGIENDEPNACYPIELLTGIVEWCIQKKLIDRFDAIKGFDELFGEDYPLPQKRFLTHVGYKIEEYLADKKQLRQCLTEVIHCQAQLEEFHLLLARLPILGFISTTYDTFIEIAYAQVNRKKLPKFYTSSIQGALKAYREGRPFILKLYGDTDNADSLIFGRRIANGLSGIVNPDELQSLLTISSPLFIGFEARDPDLKIFNDILQRNSVINRCSISSSPDLGIEDQHFEPKNRYQGENKTFRPISYQLKQLQTDIGTATSETLLSVSAVKESILSKSDMLESEQQTKVVPIFDRKVRGAPIEVFTAYAQQDKPYFDEINQILDIISKKGFNISHHYSEVVNSVEWRSHNYLTTARLILLLVSRSFLNSSFCYDPQMIEVVEKHGKGYYLIPIMVKPAEKLLKGDHADSCVTGRL